MSDIKSNSGGYLSDVLNELKELKSELKNPLRAKVDVEDNLDDFNKKVEKLEKENIEVQARYKLEQEKHQKKNIEKQIKDEINDINPQDLNMGDAVNPVPGSLPQKVQQTTEESVEEGIENAQGSSTTDLDLGQMTNVMADGLVKKVSSAIKSVFKSFEHDFKLITIKSKDLYEGIHFDWDLKNNQEVVKEFDDLMSKMKSSNPNITIDDMLASAKEELTDMNEQASKFKQIISNITKGTRKWTFNDMLNDPEKFGKELNELLEQYDSASKNPEFGTENLLNLEAQINAMSNIHNRIFSELKDYSEKTKLNNRIFDQLSNSANSTYGRLEDAFANGRNLMSKDLNWIVSSDLNLSLVDDYDIQSLKDVVDLLENIQKLKNNISDENLINFYQSQIDSNNKIIEELENRFRKTFLEIGTDGTSNDEWYSNQYKFIAEHINKVEEYKKKLAEIKGETYEIQQATAETVRESLGGQNTQLPEIVKKEYDIVSSVVDLKDKSDNDLKQLILRWIAQDENILEIVEKMKNRTFDLTSDYGARGSITSYGEKGSYVQLEGTRSSANFFVDAEGKRIRKPRNLPEGETRDGLFLYDEMYQTNKARQEFLEYQETIKDTRVEAEKLDEEVKETAQDSEKIADEKPKNVIDVEGLYNALDALQKIKDVFNEIYKNSDWASLFNFGTIEEPLKALQKLDLSQLSSLGYKKEDIDKINSAIQELKDAKAFGKKVAKGTIDADDWLSEHGTPVEEIARDGFDHADIIVDKFLNSIQNKIRKTTSDSEKIVQASIDKLEDRYTDLINKQNTVDNFNEKYNPDTADIYFEGIDVPSMKTLEDNGLFSLLKLDHTNKEINETKNRLKGFFSEIEEAEKKVYDAKHAKYFLQDNFENKSLDDQLKFFDNITKNSKESKKALQELNNEFVEMDFVLKDGTKRDVLSAMDYGLDKEFKNYKELRDQIDHIEIEKVFDDDIAGTWEMRVRDLFVEIQDLIQPYLTRFHDEIQKVFVLDDDVLNNYEKLTEKLGIDPFRENAVDFADTNRNKLKNQLHKEFYSKLKDTEAPYELINMYNQFIEDIDSKMQFPKVSEMIDTINNKAKELGYTFDETANKWTKIVEPSEAIDLRKLRQDDLIQFVKNLQKTYKEYDDFVNEMSDSKDIDYDAYNAVAKKLKGFTDTLEKYEDVIVHLKKGGSYSLLNDSLYASEWNTKASSIKNVEIIPKVRQEEKESAEDVAEYIKKTDYEIYESAMQMAKNREKVFEDMANQEITLANKMAGETKQMYGAMAQDTYKLFTEGEDRYAIENKMANTNKLINDLQAQIETETDSKLLSSLNEQLDQAKIKLLTLQELFPQLKPFYGNGKVFNTSELETNTLDKYWRTQRQDWAIGDSHYNISKADKEYLDNLTKEISSEKELKDAIEARKQKMAETYAEFQVAEEKYLALQKQKDALPYGKEKDAVTQEYNEAFNSAQKILEDYNEMRDELVVLNALQDNFGKSLKDASEINVGFLDEEWRDMDQVFKTIDDEILQIIAHQKEMSSQVENTASKYKSMSSQVKLHYYNNQDDYDKDTLLEDGSPNYKNLENVVNVIDTEKKLAIDLDTTCKTAETAVRRLFAAMGEQFPLAKEWEDGFEESVANGQYSFYDKDIPGSFSVEELEPGRFYVTLNILKDIEEQADKTNEALNTPIISYDFDDEIDSINRVKTAEMSLEDENEELISSMKEVDRQTSSMNLDEYLSFNSGNPPTLPPNTPPSNPPKPPSDFEDAINNYIADLESVGEGARLAKEEIDKMHSSMADDSGLDIMRSAIDSEKDFFEHSGWIRNQTRSRAAGLDVNYTEALSKVLDRVVTNTYNKKTDEWETTEVFKANYDKLAKEIVDKDTAIIKLNHDIAQATEEEAIPLRKNRDILQEELDVYERLLEFMVRSKNYRIDSSQKDILNQQRDKNATLLQNQLAAQDARNERILQSAINSRLSDLMILKEQMESKGKSTEGIDKLFDDLSNVKNKNELSEWVNKFKEFKNEVNLGKGTVKSFGETWDDTLSKINKSQGKILDKEQAEDLKWAKTIGTSKEKQWWDDAHDKNGNWTGALAEGVEQTTSAFDKLISKYDEYAKANQELNKQSKLFESAPLTYADSFADAQEEVKRIKYEIEGLTKDVDIDLLSDDEIIKLDSAIKKVRELIQIREAATEVSNKKASDVENKKVQAELEKEAKIAQKAQEAKNKAYITAGDEVTKDAIKAYKELTNSAKEYYELRIKEEQGTINATEKLRLEELTEQWHKAKEARDEYASAPVAKGKTYEDYDNARKAFEAVDSESSKIARDYANELGNIQNTLQGFVDSKKYTSELNDSLEKTIKDIQSLNKNPIDLNSEETIKEIARIRNKFDEFKKDIKTADFKLAQEESIAKLNAKITDFMHKNSKMGEYYRQQFDRLKLDFDSEHSLEEVKKIVAEFAKLEEEVTSANKVGKSFFDMLRERATGVNAQLIAQYLSWQDWIRYARQAFDAIYELDTALIDLKKTTTMNNQDLEEFYMNSTNIAKRMGVTTKEIIEQASAWSRLGYSDKKAAESMAELSSQFASISPGLGTEDAQLGLVSIMKAWDIPVEEVKRVIMDNINVLGNKFAETNRDIIEGMKRAGATLSAVGMNPTESFALFTGAQEVIQNAETVGTALKTLSLRIRGYDEETEQLSDDVVAAVGKVADLTKVASNGFAGISLWKDADQTEYKSLVTYLGEISKIWDEIGAKEQTELLDKLFGKRGASVGSAILQNFDQVEKALTKMENAEGAADAEMSIIQESWQYKLNALKQTWVGTLQEMINRGQINELLDKLISLSEALGDIIVAIGPFPSLIAAIGLPQLILHLDKIPEILKAITETNALEKLFGSAKSAEQVAETYVSSFKLIPEETEKIAKQASDSFNKTFDVEAAKNFLKQANGEQIFKDAELDNIPLEFEVKPFDSKEASKALSEAASQGAVFKDIEEEAEKTVETVNRTFGGINLDDAQANMANIAKANIFKPLTDEASMEAKRLQDVMDGEFIQLGHIDTEETIAKINSLEGEIGKLPDSTKDSVTRTIETLDELAQQDDWNFGVGDVIEESMEEVVEVVDNSVEEVADKLHELAEIDDWNWGDSVEDAMDDVVDIVSDTVDDINDSFATDIDFDIDVTDIEEGMEAITEYTDDTFDICEDAINNFQESLNDVDTDEVADGIERIGESAQRSSAGLQILKNLVINLGITAAITLATAAVIKLANAEKTLAQRAEQAARAMKSTKDNVNNYRSEVDKLSKVLRDENSTLEEKVEARQGLLDIQRDLLDQYGKEETAVGLINDIIGTSTDTMITYEDSINKVATAWENLELKAIEAAGRQSDAQDDWLTKQRNKLLYGTESSFRANQNKYESMGGTVWNPFYNSFTDKGKKLEEYAKQLGGFKFESIFGDSFMFNNKSAKELVDIYEKLIAYAKTLGIENDSWINNLQSKIDELNNLIDNTQPYRDAKAEAYIANDNTYQEAKKFIDEQYKAYNEAMAEDDTELAEQIMGRIQSKLSYIEEKARTDGKDYVADWFEIVYAEIQSRINEGAVDKWFDELDTYQFSDENFAGAPRTNKEIAQGFINRLGTVSPDDLYDIYNAWEDSSIFEADNRWHSIAETASELFSYLKNNNIEMDKFVKLAQQRNILDTQDETIAKKRFGEGTVTLEDGTTKDWSSQAIKDWIDSLSEEDLAILLTLKLDPDYRYTIAELKAEFDKAKEEIEKNPIKVKTEFDQTKFSSTIGNLKKVTDAYDKWRDQLNEKKKVHLDITEVEQFRELVADIEDFDFDNFESILTSSTSSVDDVNAAFNSMFDAILKSQVPIEQINAANRDMIQTQLEEAGMNQQVAQQYVNSGILRAEAEQKVTQELLNELAAQEEYNQVADEGNQKHNETIDHLMSEAEQLGLTNLQLLQYIYAMAEANGLTISGDYSWLISLCEQLGIAISDVEALKAALSGVSSSSFNSDIDKRIQQAYQMGDVSTARDLISQKKEFNELTDSLKQTGDALNETDYQSRKAADGLGKAGGGAGKAADDMDDAADAAKDASAAIDDLQDAYQKLKKIMDSYNKTGKISVDQAQELMQMDFRYLNMLKNENGALSLNEQAFENATKAKLSEMRVTMMRNALNTMQSITTEAQAEAYLAVCTGEANMAATEAVAIQAALEQQMRGATGAIAEAYNVIYQGLQNAMALLGGEGFANVDFSGLTEAAGDASGEMAEGAQQEFEKVYDWLERRMKVLQKEADLYAAKRANADKTYYSRSDGANYWFNQEIKTQKKRLETAKEQVKVYGEEYKKAIEGLDQDIIDGIEGNGHSIQTITDQAMSEAIDKAIEWKDKLDDAKISVEEIQTKIGDLAVEKIEYLGEVFERFTQKVRHFLDFSDFNISAMESHGYSPTPAMYKQQAKNYKKLAYKEGKKADRMEAKRQQLIEAGTLIKNSEQDLKLQEEIYEVEQARLEAMEKQAEAEKSARDAARERLEMRHSIVKSYDDELQSIYELYNQDAAIDDKAHYTDTAYGMVATQTYSYKENIAEVARYKKELANLEKTYKDGKIGAAEYREQEQNLRNGMYESAEAAKSAKDAIVDLAKERIEKEIDIIEEQIKAYQDLIKKQQEALKSQKDLHDYQKSVAESQKDIYKITRKLAAIENDNSQSAIAKRKQLEEELAEAREKLEDKQYNHSMDVADKALSAQAEAYEEAKNKEIERLQEKLKNVDLLFSETVNGLNGHMEEAMSSMTSMLGEYGVAMSDTISSAMMTGIEKGSTGVGQYLKNLIAELNEYDIKTKEEEARQLKVQEKEEYFTKLATEQGDLKNKIAVLESKNIISTKTGDNWIQAYDKDNPNGTKYSLNQINNLYKQGKYNEALEALEQLIYHMTKKKKGKSASAQKDIDNLISAVRSWGKKIEKAKKKFSKYAGGVRTLKKDEIAWTQEYGDEAILSPTRNAILTPLKAGDTVLTKAQTENLYKMAQDPQEFMRSVMNVNKVKTNNVGSVTLSIGNVLSVQGDVNDSNAREMAAVAQKAITKAFNELNSKIKK